MKPSGFIVKKYCGHKKNASEEAFEKSKELYWVALLLHL